MFLSPTLQSPENVDFQDDTSHPGVKKALSLIERFRPIQQQKEAELDAVQDLLESSFEVSNPTGTRKIPSYLLQQAIFKTNSRMKPLDFSLHAEGVDPTLKNLVSAGVAYTLQKAGWLSALRDNFGAFYRMTCFGDAFIRVGADPESNFPIIFQNSSLTSLYFDPYATDLRSRGSEFDADELCVVYTYSWDEAKRLYPQLAENGRSGKLPVNVSQAVSRHLTREQEAAIGETETHVAHYYCLSEKRYMIFAGRGATVLQDLSEEDYPFVKDERPYLPLIHLKCFPQMRGIYNAGLGQILYKLAVITRILMNKGLNHALDNVDPLRIIRVPKGQAASFFNKIKVAQELQAAGKKGLIMMEGEDADAGKLETLSAPALTTEWERLFKRLDIEVRRLGVDLDDAITDPKKTLGALHIEEENRNSFVQQILEQNTGEFQFAIELALDFLRKFVRSEDETAITLTEKVKLDDGSLLEIGGVTLGMVADELRSREYSVEVNSRSGAYPSNLLQQARLDRLLASVPSGTRAFNSLLVQKARLNGVELNEEDLSIKKGG